MFKNILVGVDGRPGGRGAIALAKQLVDEDGTIVLVHSFCDHVTPYGVI